jgi:hypothetical protein
MGGKRTAYRLLAGKPEGKRPLERPRFLRKILKWILKKEGGTVGATLIWLKIGNFRFPENADDFLSSWAAIGVSRTETLRSSKEFNVVGRDTEF